MEPPRFQISVTGLLVLVACVALNLWLFRVHIFLGLLGLNVSKHVLIACLCRSLGVDKGRSGPRTTAPATEPPGPSLD